MLNTRWLALTGPLTSGLNMPRSVGAEPNPPGFVPNSKTKRHRPMTNYNRVLTCSVLSLLLFYDAIGQDKKVPEPENIGVIYYLDSASNALVGTERQIVRGRAKLRALGFGGYRVVAEVEREHSSLRLKAGQTLEFVLQLPWGIDPLKMRLYRLEAKDGKRQVVFGSATLMTAKTGYFQVNVTRFGEHSYKFATANPLTPGEYAFM